MANQILKARYTTSHKLVVIMNGDWTLKTEAVRKYNVEVPSFASVRASYKVTTDITEITFSWCQVDDCPEYMLQP